MIDFISMIEFTTIMETNLGSDGLFRNVSQSRKMGPKEGWYHSMDQGYSEYREKNELIISAYYYLLLYCKSV